MSSKSISLSRLAHKEGSYPHMPRNVDLQPRDPLQRKLYSQAP